jgi:TrpR-related protein YerC/YecD
MTQDKKALYQAILYLKNESEAQKFLRDLLTEAEINEFANRWKVARMLDAKVPYETIAEKTGMSSTTIARISKWLNNGMGGYKLMVKRLNANQNKNHHHTSSLAV